MFHFVFSLKVFLVSIILISINSNTLLSQSPNDLTLPISGRVMLNGKTIDKVKISIFQDNQLIDSIFTGPNGKFNYVLSINSQYALIFGNFEDSQKNLIIETFIPNGLKEIKPYNCIIRLDAEFVDDLKNAELYLDYPIGIVKFDKESGMFELDYHYSRSRIREVK